MLIHRFIRGPFLGAALLGAAAWTTFVTPARAAEPTPPKKENPAGATETRVATDAPPTDPTDAGQDAPEEEPSRFSKKALRKLTFGLEAELGLGVGSYVGTDSHLFYKPKVVVATGMPPAGTPLVSPGLSKQAAFGVRFRPLSIGLQLDFTSYGNASGNDAASFSSRQILGYVRPYFTSLKSPVQVYLQVEGGQGTFAEDAPASATSASVSRTVYALEVGARFGIDARPIASVPGLTVGGIVAADGWITQNQCTAMGGGAEECVNDLPSAKKPDRAPNLGFSLAAAVRFTLPITTQKPAPASSQE